MIVNTHKNEHEMRQVVLAHLSSLLFVFFKKAEGTFALCDISVAALYHFSLKVDTIEISKNFSRLFPPESSLHIITL